MESNPGPVMLKGRGLAAVLLAWQLYERGVVFSFEGHPVAGASRVAAGLINPVTGKGMNPSWEVEHFLPLARAFFRKKEELLGVRFWHESEVVRVFEDEAERGRFEKKREKLKPLIQREFAKLEVRGSCYGGVSWVGGAWVDIPTFLDASFAFFAKILPNQSPGDAKIAVRCGGAQDLEGALARIVPFRVAKGEIGEFFAPDWGEKKILNRRGWVIPLGDGYYRAGANYLWDQADSLPSKAGSEYLRTLINSFVAEGEWDFTRQSAGRRPIASQSDPVWGSCSSEGEFYFNGLGSKGCLYGPEAALRVVDYLFEESGKPTNVSQKWLSKSDFS